ncbi:hypothetical protein ACRAKI_34805 [Saccharothrix isguenensis]
MRASKALPPLTRRGRVVCWFLIVFIVLVGLGVGGSLIGTGLEGRAAVAEGPVGVLTPTDRQCGKNGCSWIGDFESEDGAVVRAGVPLNDAVTVRKGDPTPSRIADVRLADDPERPAAYTADFNWVSSVVGGAFFLAGCLVGGFVLARMVRRYRPRRA